MPEASTSSFCTQCNLMLSCCNLLPSCRLHLHCSQPQKSRAHMRRKRTLLSHGVVRREQERTGSGLDSSSRADDTGRMQSVVVKRTSGQDAFKSALVVSQVIRIGQNRRTAGEPHVASIVGLGKVESGSTPARHTLSDHQWINSMRLEHSTEQLREEKSRGV